MCKLHVNTCKWSSILSCDTWCSYWDCCGLSDVSSHGVAECVCWSVSSVGKHLVSRVRSHESESPSWWITFWCFIHPKMTFVFCSFYFVLKNDQWKRIWEVQEGYWGTSSWPPAQLFSKCSVSDYSTLFSRILFLRHDVTLQLNIRHWQKSQWLFAERLKLSRPRTPDVLPLVLNALKDDSCLWCRLLQF